LVTDALLGARHLPDDVRAILGGNALRLFREQL